MIIRDWRPYVSGGLHGYVRVELDSGLVIPGIKVMAGSRGPFVLLPEQPVLKDGKLKRDINNRVVYAATVQWRDRATADKFSAAVIELLLQRYPNALEPGNDRN
jgi:DNA-binding cell septation regulator SpoVG